MKKISKSTKKRLVAQRGDGKVPGKQKTYQHGNWTIKVPRKGSKLSNELIAAVASLKKTGGRDYRPLELQ